MLLEPLLPRPIAMGCVAVALRGLEHAGVAMVDDLFLSAVPLSFSPLPALSLSLSLSLSGYIYSAESRCLRGLSRETVVQVFFNVPEVAGIMEVIDSHL